MDNKTRREMMDERNKYFREYRKAHKEQTKQYQERYWKKRADETAKKST